MGAEVLGDGAKADAREEVDCEPRVSGIISRHQTFPSLRHRGIARPGTGNNRLLFPNISQFNILYFVYILRESKVVIYLSTNFVIPRNSANSWKSNFMKILELEVVSSSFSLITCSTSQPMASVWRRWEKNLATFLKSKF